jgi:hypothetical protein
MPVPPIYVHGLTQAQAARCPFSGHYAVLPIPSVSAFRRTERLGVSIVPPIAVLRNIIFPSGFLEMSESAVPSGLPVPQNPRNSQQERISES